MKLFKTSVLIAIMALSLWFPSYGLVEPSAVTKKEIIEKSWQALFGKLKNREVQSIYVEGYFHGGETPNRMTLKRPDKFRNEVSSGILVFDGKRAAWAKRYPDKEGNPRKPEIIDSRHWLHFEVDIALLFPAFFDYDSEYRGVITFKGKQYYQLYVKLPMGAWVSYFIDTGDFLIKRRLVSWQGDPDDGGWENIIDRYIDYGGIKFPDGYSYPGQQGREKGIYKNFRINTDPDQSLFMIPEELR